MTISQQCPSCKHIRDRMGDVMVCDAFPLGIPQEILDGNVRHDKPYPGDNGIQWEPWEEEETGPVSTS